MRRPIYWVKHHKKVGRKINDSSVKELDEFFKKLELCKRVNELVASYSTGTLEELARRLKIKQRKLMGILIFMIDELDCPIEYDALLRTYFYNGEGELKIGFVPFTAE
jgi:hypothetical protein